MIERLLRFVRKPRHKPLADCPDRAPGTVYQEGSANPMRVVVLQANSTGIVVQVECPITDNHPVIGEYDVSGTRFGYRGVVEQIEANQDGTWNWHIRFLMAGV